MNIIGAYEGHLALALQLVQSLCRLGTHFARAVPQESSGKRLTSLTNRYLHLLPPLSA